MKNDVFKVNIFVAISMLCYGAAVGLTLGVVGTSFAAGQYGFDLPIGVGIFSFLIWCLGYVSGDIE